MLQKKLNYFFKRLSYYWHMFWIFRKMRVMALLEYRGNFFFWLIVATVWTIFNFFFFSLIANVNNGFGGWSVKELYLLFSVFTIFEGFMWSWMNANMQKYTKAVFSGDIGTLLMKPIDTQFMVMMQENDFDNIFRILIGFGALIWSLRQLPYQTNPIKILIFGLLFCCALILLYSLWFIIATFSFWVERLDNINDIFPNLQRMWQLPRVIYSGIASTFFTVILPLALLVSIPSEILVNKFSPIWSIYFILFSFITFFISP